MLHRFPTAKEETRNRLEYDPDMQLKASPENRSEWDIKRPRVALRSIGREMMRVPEHSTKLMSNANVSLNTQQRPEQQPVHLPQHTNTFVTPQRTVTLERVCKFIRKDANFQTIVVRRQEMAHVEGIAELHDNSPISIRGLARTCDCP
jgi:hypothetical protein